MCSSDLEIVKKMKGLSLEDEEYKKLYNKAMRTDPAWRSVLRAPATRVRETQSFEHDFPPHMNGNDPNFIQSGGGTRFEPRCCFGCGKSNHTMNRCNEIQQRVNQGVIRRDLQGRWVWKDGTEVVRRRGETWIDAIKFGTKHVGIA